MDRCDFNNSCVTNIEELGVITKWLSCNNELWGTGPTAVFGSAAALVVHSELQATLTAGAGDINSNALSLENLLISTSTIGMLALMIHIWVGAMRFFLLYLDTIIADNSSFFLELMSASLFGGRPPLPALDSITKFLKTQRHIIHITICWFLSLCWANFVRKTYCPNFNMPFFEQWQSSVQSQVVNYTQKTIDKMTSFIRNVQDRMALYVVPTPNVPVN